MSQFLRLRGALEAMRAALNFGRQELEYTHATTVTVREAVVAVAAVYNCLPVKIRRSTIVDVAAVPPRAYFALAGGEPVKKAAAVIGAELRVIPAARHGHKGRRVCVTQRLGNEWWSGGEGGGLTRRRNR